MSATHPAISANARSRSIRSSESNRLLASSTKRAELAAWRVETPTCGAYDQRAPPLADLRACKLDAAASLTAAAQLAKERGCCAAGLRCVAGLIDEGALAEDGGAPQGAARQARGRRFRDREPRGYERDEGLFEATRH
jgi:hypothetical protein